MADTHKTIGWAVIVVAILMALTEAMTWPAWLHYVWAFLVLGAGILGLSTK